MAPDVMVSSNVAAIAAMFIMNNISRSTLYLHNLDILEEYLPAMIIINIRVNR